MRRPGGGKLLDPAWRHARAMKAGLAARESHRRRAVENAERFADKSVAYAAGYRVGTYNRDRYWKAKYARALAALAAKDKAA